MALNTKGIKKVSPFTVPYLLTNMSGAILGMQAELGFRGPNYAGAAYPSNRRVFETARFSSRFPPSPADCR